MNRYTSKQGTLYAHVQTCTYACECIHTCPRTHTHTHTHTHTESIPWSALQWRQHTQRSCLSKRIVRLDHSAGRKEVEGHGLACASYPNSLHHGMVHHNATYGGRAKWRNGGKKANMLTQFVLTQSTYWHSCRGRSYHRGQTVFYTNL